MTTDEEQKLLDILGEASIPEAEGTEKTKAAVAEAFPDMDEKTQGLMARIIQAKMPTPEEIAQAEEISRHNAGIREKRQIRLAERAAKRERRQGRKRKR